MDVLLVESGESVNLVIGPVLATPVIIDTAKISRDSTVNVPKQTFQYTIFGDVVLGIGRIADEAGSVSVAAVCTCP